MGHVVREFGFIKRPAAHLYALALTYANGTIKNLSVGPLGLEVVREDIAQSLYNTIIKQMLWQDLFNHKLQSLHFTFTKASNVL